MSDELFPIVVSIKPDPNPPPPFGPYFIVAYWPHAGGWWKVHPDLFKSVPAAEQHVAKMHELGWRSIRILQLPSGVWK